MRNYNKILNEHNLKATPQRLAILEIIEKTGHINIDELYKKVKERYTSISLATIYKNINALVEKSLLVEVKLPEKKNVYEIAKENHSHLLCAECDDIIDIEVDTRSIEDHLSQKHNFDVEKTDVVLKGTCENCK